jgi:hypothetical protein
MTCCCAITMLEMSLVVSKLNLELTKTRRRTHCGNNNIILRQQVSPAAVAFSEDREQPTTTESIIIITIIIASHLSHKQTWLHRKLLHVTSLGIVELIRRFMLLDFDLLPDLSTFTFKSKLIHHV